MVEIMPVVKADAYRHGAVAIAHALENEGASWFAVSNVEEGVALRSAGVSARILVMADSLLGDRSAYEEFRLTPVVHSLEDLPAANVPYHLKIDTGMSRLGTRAPIDQIAAAVRAHSAPLEGLMTHFASAADYESPQTDKQVEAFEKVRAGLQSLGIDPPYIHASATTPVAYGRSAAWGTLVRPGHAIYGYVSQPRGNAPANQLDVQPALTWKVTVLAVKDLEPGARIGYGGMHTAVEPMRVAVLAAGYADGIPHRLGNRGSCLNGFDNDRRYDLP
jgi:alanine racemase